MKAKIDYSKIMASLSDKTYILGGMSQDSVRQGDWKSLKKLEVEGHVKLTSAWRPRMQQEQDLIRCTTDFPSFISFCTVKTQPL